MSKLFKSGKTTLAGRFAELSGTSRLPDSILSKRDGMKEIRAELDGLLGVFKYWAKAIEAVHEANKRAHLVFHFPEMSFACKDGVHGPNVDDTQILSRLQSARSCIKRKIGLLSAIEKQVGELQGLLATRDRLKRRYEDGQRKVSNGMEKIKKLKDEYEEAAWRYFDALTEAEASMDFVVEESKGNGGSGLARAEICTLRLVQMKMFRHCLEYSQSCFEEQADCWKQEMRHKEWEAWSQEKDESVAVLKTNLLQPLLREDHLGSIESLVDRFGSLSALGSADSFKSDAPAPPPPPPLPPRSRDSSFTSTHGVSQASPRSLQQHYSSSQLSLASAESRHSLGSHASSEADSPPSSLHSSPSPSPRHSDVGLFSTETPLQASTERAIVANQGHGTGVSSFTNKNDAPPPPPPPPPPPSSEVQPKALASDERSSAPPPPPPPPPPRSAADAATAADTPAIATTSAPAAPEKLEPSPEILERVNLAFQIGDMGTWKEYIDRSSGDSFWVNESLSEIREEPPDEE